jgi:hypothetical protein
MKIFFLILKHRIRNSGDREWEPGPWRPGDEHEHDSKNADGSRVPPSQGFGETSHSPRQNAAAGGSSGGAPAGPADTTALRERKEAAGKPPEPADKNVCPTSRHRKCSDILTSSHVFPRFWKNLQGEDWQMKNEKLEMEKHLTPALSPRLRRAEREMIARRRVASILERLQRRVSLALLRPRAGALRECRKETSQRDVSTWRRTTGQGVSIAGAEERSGNCAFLASCGIWTRRWRKKLASFCAILRIFPDVPAFFGNIFFRGLPGRRPALRDREGKSGSVGFRRIFRGVALLRDWGRKKPGNWEGIRLVIRRRKRSFGATGLGGYEGPCSAKLL